MYRVTFYKALTNSYGMPFIVCQRSIDMVAARDAEQALAAAKPIFEQREHVPNWSLHADSVEAEAVPVPALAHAGRRRAQEAHRTVDAATESSTVLGRGARAGRKVLASHKGRSGC